VMRTFLAVEDLPSRVLIQLIARSGLTGDIHFLNSYNIGLMFHNADYRKLISNSRINVIDGRILVLAIFLYKRRRANQIRGIDFLRGCLDLDSSGTPFFRNHFFLGGTQEVLDLITKKISDNHPSLVVDSYSPPFLPLSEFNLTDMVKIIAMTKPDIIWVGLGKPKQDYITSYLASQLNVPVVAVGAAFDFLADSKKESTKKLQSLGLEWLHRLKEEPLRLWRRYLIVSPLVFFFPFLLKLQLKQRDY